MPKDSKKKQKKDKNSKRAKLEKRLRKQSQSEWCEARVSGIHQTGVFATQAIPEETQIIQYVGEKLKNDEAEQRGLELADEVEGTDDASVFNFILDDEHQIDGNNKFNTARFLNHSCDPNCWIDIIKKRIWIIALRDIEEGEELTYDYGFDVEHWEDHPCRCGSDNCIGYIVCHDQWDELKELLKKKEKKAARKKRKRTKKKK